MAFINNTQRIYEAIQLLQHAPARRIVLIADDAHQLQAYKRLLDFFRPQQKTLIVPDREILPYDRISPHAGLVSARIGAFYRLLNGDYQLLAMTIDTLMQRVAPRAHFIAQGLVLQKGMTMARAAFIRRLHDSGYELCDKVREVGQYAVRGSLLDLFPSSALLPYRLDWFDDQIEMIRSFSPDDQRSLEDLTSINLLPPNEFPLSPAAREQFVQNWQQTFSGEARRSTFYRQFKEGGLPQGAEAYLPLFFHPAKCECLFDYIAAATDAPILLKTANTDQRAAQFRQYATECYVRRRETNPEDTLPVNALYLTEDEYRTQIAKYDLPPDRAATGLSGLSPPPLEPSEGNDLFQLITQSDERILIALNTPERRELIEAQLKDHAYTRYDDWHQFITSDEHLGVIHSNIAGGLRDRQAGWILITESELFTVTTMDYEAAPSAQQQNLQTLIEDLTQIRDGDLLVHLDHGVGIFRGLHNINSDEIMQEFLCLEYAEETLLYVPVNNLHLILRYAGLDGQHRQPDKLGGKKWRTYRAEAAKRIVDTAAELLTLYARRASQPGLRTAKPDRAYHAFAAAFPYHETTEQRRAIEDVVKDMSSTQSMDRLICGDVGFGKTEVAMRAAYLAAQTGYQTALLVPTTLLANQHLASFRERFADTTIKVEMLTRLSGQTETIYQAVATGDCAIIIGTHALLNDRMRFQNLGLLIIDEEHRFGVRQKEKIKKMRTNLDVLSLTATPIPRTLNMAISGLQNISLIASPPKDRLAIKTFICAYDEDLRRDAINRELRRGGQVYYVYNDIPHIPEMVTELQQIFPHAHCASIHGRMPKKQMKEIMDAFYGAAIDILVCTTIIENGIDVPNANTMIVERADRFGLAQLHQLRGRIGRREHQAYAYCLTEGTPSPAARKRLNALAQAQGLGVGFTLAAYDMEIRGVGDILSAEQSGDVQKIGMDLYSRLLEATIRDLRAGKTIADMEMAHTEVDIGISALLLERYVFSPYERLSIYRRLAEAKEAQLKNLRHELEDRFGPLPAETENLFAVQQIKMRAENLDIIRIKMNRGGGYLVMRPNSPAQRACINRASKAAPQEYSWQDDRLVIRRGFTNDGECLMRINEALNMIAAWLKPEPKPAQSTLRPNPAA